MPAVFENRSFAAGGLASYGSNALDSYRLTGVYVARILRGEKPADLPVQRIAPARAALRGAMEGEDIGV